MTIPSQNPTSNPAGTSVQTIITQVAEQIAAQEGVDPNRLIRIALATAQVESGDNPTAVGDDGTSFGLYQLHEGGELGNLSEAQADNPTTNATVAITQMAAILRANPSASDGEIAAMAQRPANEQAYAMDVQNVENGGTTQPFDGATSVSSPQTVGSPAGTTPTFQGQTLSMSDLPAVDAYIRQNWASYAWLLDNPSVKGVLEKAAVQGLDTSQVQAELAQTPWWQQTSSAQRNYEQDRAINPGDYSFTVAGSKASQTYAQIMAMAAQNGVGLSVAQGQNLANMSLQYGWTSEQTQQNIASYVHPNTAGDVYKQLQAANGQYYINTPLDTQNSWAHNIAAGTATLQQYEAYLAQQASIKWKGMAPEIQQGMTPYQITDAYRTEAAKTMEVDPTQIDFMTNPTYSKILDFVPPGETAPRMMTMSEMDQYLKGTTAYGYTQGARDNVASLAKTVTNAFGMT